MKRRQFLKSASLGLAVTAVAKPALAQSNPTIRWRLTSSFPKSLDAIYGASDTIARIVAESTDNQFQMQTFAAGEIVPGLNAMDAVSSGTVEACHTASYYYFGKGSRRPQGPHVSHRWLCWNDDPEARRRTSADRGG